MGKKGAKKKTRWRTLSIGTPPGEEDEEDGLRNGYDKGQENGTDRGQGGYKPRRNGTGGSTSGYGSGGSRSRRGDDSTRSPSQPKTMFNESEYTKITTPRQDLIFKKGYLSQKKPWASTASTSATPSTTESQSASHSTADGSETTEDQQLLDSGNGEFAPVMERPAQLSYGTFYDHNSGFYYEYPVMLMAPPVPDQLGPNYLTSMSCNAVPLRPVEWVNPAFVPKISDQQYCLMDYQTGQAPDCAVVVDEHGKPLPVDPTNGLDESASYSGSITGEYCEELPEEPEEGTFNGSFIDSASLAQPVPLPHVVPPVPQPYLYPGHYMFGPQLVNVNGVTIQSGPMVRCNEVVNTNASVACAKRRKKKKRRKQKRLPTLGNTEDDEEEEDYSSEGEQSTPSSRLQWPSEQSAPPSPAPSNRPLNPECQEFQLRSSISDSQNQTASTTARVLASTESSTETSEKTESNSQVLKNANGEPKRLTCDNAKQHNAEISLMCSNERVSDANDASSVRVILPESNPETIIVEKPCSSSRAPSPEINRTTTPINSETQRLPVSYESLVTRPQVPRRKYSKNAKFVREPTPAPDLEETPLQENGAESTSESCCETAEVNGEDRALLDGSQEDSGFESQTRKRSRRPITDAVTEWLRRANSPEIFVTNLSDSVSEEEDDDDEPPKNLQGNPMPALSVNGNVDDERSLRLASCGKFARPNCGTTEHPAEAERTRRKKGSKNAKQRSGTSEELTSGTSEMTEKDVVGVCEFTEEDSVVGVRVAASSRMTKGRKGVRKKGDAISERVNARVLEVSEAAETLPGDALPVRTYEKGEVVVSIEGKILPVTSFEPFLSRSVVEGGVVSAIEEHTEDERASSVGSIEEPDVLECWEAEIVEPISTQKVVDSNDNTDSDNTNLECVRKYYRLSQSVNSNDDETTDAKMTVSEELVDSVCSEESLPPFQSLRKPSPPVEEAFEAYESFCTNQKRSFFRSRFLLGSQEATLPCRIVCCNLQ